jgi:hypothetical protein
MLLQIGLLREAIMPHKPVILWTCDVVGWAYYNRIERLSKAMPQYEHRIWYFGNHQPMHVKQKLLGEADIIVCQGVKSLRIAQLKSIQFTQSLIDNPQKALDARFANILVRIDSFRVDHNGEYYDIWSGEKLPG